MATVQKKSLFMLTSRASGYFAHGPWRRGKDILTWNGDAYVLFSREIDPPEYRFQAVMTPTRLRYLESTTKLWSFTRRSFLAINWQVGRLSYSINNMI